MDERTSSGHRKSVFFVRSSHASEYKERNRTIITKQSCLCYGNPPICYVPGLKPYNGWSLTLPFSFLKPLQITLSSYLITAASSMQLIAIITYFFIQHSNVSYGGSNLSRCTHKKDNLI